MKNKIILGLSAVLPFALTSCGGIGKLNREVFKTSDFKTVNQRYLKMMENQYTSKNEKRTGITLKSHVKNGVMTYKYKFVGKGTMRYLDLSLHKVDANLSAGFILSWDLDKEILKVEGEDETHYYLKNDKSYYHCVDCVTNNVEKHKKVLIEDVTNDSEFEDYVGETIDYYTAFLCPLAFSFAPGITGNYEVGLFNSNDWELIPYEYTVANIFTEETNKLIEDHKTKGYNLNATYGSNDENTVCAAINGKGNLEILHGTDERGIGDFEIDLFASYKNNFVSQVELGFKGDRHEAERKYTNYKIHYEYNVLQDLKPGEYKPDSVDITKYDDYKE